MTASWQVAGSIGARLFGKGSRLAGQDDSYEASEQRDEVWLRAAERSSGGQAARYEDQQLAHWIGSFELSNELSKAPPFRNRLRPPLQPYLVRAGSGKRSLSAVPKSNLPRLRSGIVSDSGRRRSRARDQFG